MLPEMDTDTNADAALFLWGDGEIGIVLTDSSKDGNTTEVVL